MKNMFTRRQITLAAALLLGVAGTVLATQTFGYVCTWCGLRQQFNQPQFTLKCPQCGHPMRQMSSWEK